MRALIFIQDLRQRRDTVEPTYIIIPTYMYMHVFLKVLMYIPVYMHANVQFLLHYDTKLRGCREQMLVASAP